MHREAGKRKRRGERRKLHLEVKTRSEMGDYLLRIDLDGGGSEKVDSSVSMYMDRVHPVSPFPKLAQPCHCLGMGRCFSMEQIGCSFEKTSRLPSLLTSLIQCGEGLPESIGVFLKRASFKI